MLCDTCKKNKSAYVVMVERDGLCIPEEICEECLDRECEFIKEVLCDLSGK